MFLNREGDISIFRVGVFLGIIGLLFIVGGNILFRLDEAGRRRPLSVEVYPGAELFTQRETSSVSRTLIYWVNGATPEEVARHYQRELDSFASQDSNNPGRELCIRTPELGSFPDYAPGTGVLPYFFRCIFENSSQITTRYTVVTVEPGVRNDRLENPTNYEGLTFITYEQVWGG